jgi:hypothetical protein
MQKLTESPWRADGMALVGKPGSLERKMWLVRNLFRQHGLEIDDEQAIYAVTLLDLAVAGKLPPGFEPGWPDFEMHSGKEGLS